MRGIAAFAGEHEARFVELPVPDGPGRGEVVCRTLELGVCGTDREILESREPLIPPGEEFLVLGHECLARVEAVGQDVDELAEGDLVVPVVRRPKKPADVRVDLLHFGSYTERGIVREHGFSTPLWIDRPEHLLRVPRRLAPCAVLTEPVSVSEKGVNEALAVQQARVGCDCWSDEPPRVLVTGMGPIGFAAVLASRARGWPVTLYGRDEEDSDRATLARQIGAEYLPEARANFVLDDVEAHGYDLVLECTGSDAVMIRTARALRARGVMVWLGSSRQPKAQEHNLARMMRDGVLRNHVHIGCVNSAPRDFRDAMLHLEQVAQQCPAFVEGLITDRVAPRDSLWHYHHRRPQGIKTVLMYGE